MVAFMGLKFPETTRAILQPMYSSKGIISLGRRMAKFYLSIYDATYGIWFMYKTGQLSYDYYKQYCKLDERFGIQNKMDAWNARFIQGKKNFDEWERQNEIGRRVLAGFRTAWLVEEKRCVFVGARLPVGIHSARFQPLSSTLILSTLFSIGGSKHDIE